MHWIRFLHDGRTGFGTLADGVVTPHDGDPFGRHAPAGAAIPAGVVELLAPVAPGKIIFEGELGLVIGRTCRNATPSDALNALFGCTCVNDVTAIGLLKKDPSFPQWTRSKAADTFGVLGPAVATGLDPSALRVRTEVNGQERQRYEDSPAA